MAVIAEVIKRGVYGVIDGQTVELPVGYQTVKKAVPPARSGKWKVVKEVDDSELRAATNESPDVRMLREEGKTDEADALAANPELEKDAVKAKVKVTKSKAATGGMPKPSSK